MKGLIMSIVAAGIAMAGVLPASATAQALQRIEESVRANGLEFRVVRRGPDQGRTVLLLHGFPENADTWDIIAEGLAARGYRVIAFDQRGYSAGARPADPHAYGFDLFVADALAIADHYGADRFDVAGLGMGAAQSWLLAARYPERVRSLVALRFPHPAAFANGIANDPGQKASWARLQADLGGETLDARAARLLADDARELRAFLARSGLPQPHLDRYVARLQEPGALVGAISWEHAVQLDNFATTPPVRVPTLYFWSEGPALTASTAQATGRHVEAPYVIEELKGAGNFMIETSSDRLLASMLRFFESVPPDA